MAEELRFFLRPGLYVAAAGLVYWLVSGEASGTVLLAALVVATVAIVGPIAGMVPRAVRTGAEPGRGAGGPLGVVNRAIGFDEPFDARAPLEGGPELVPLASGAPILAAAALVLVGLGLIFGAWLIVPGIALVAIAGFGWLTQLDRVD